METHKDQVKLISKKEIEKSKRQKEILRYLTLLLVSNSFTAFVFSYTEEEIIQPETLTLTRPEGFDEMVLKGESFVSTTGSSIKILSTQNQLICNEAIFEREISPHDGLSDFENLREYSLYVSPKCLSKILTVKTFKFVPRSFEALQKDNYEIIY